jgi:prevent-host-death family protein
MQIEPNAQSVAQSRQNLPSLIEAAQATPQIIAKRGQAVAALVSYEYFQKAQVVLSQQQDHEMPNFYERLIALRNAFEPSDELGFLFENTVKSRKS